MNLTQWINANEKCLELSISLLNLLITAALTLLIIVQTKRLNRQQSGLQKRQIQVETYPYKREIYSYVFAVLELCNQMLKLVKIVDLYSKTPDEILQFYQILQAQYLPNVREALWSMREAEYVLPENISSVVIDVRSNFDSMAVNLITPASIAKVMTTQELATMLEEAKRANIDAAILNCKTIVKHTLFIESIMPKELDISSLSK